MTKVGPHGKPSVLFRRYRTERLRSLGPFADGSALDHMLLKNAFAALGRNRAVPGAFGVNEKPRPTDANAKAAGFRPHHGKVQFGTPALEIVPGCLPLLRRRAIGAETKKDMPFGLCNAGRFEPFADGVIFGHASQRKD